MENRNRTAEMQRGKILLYVMFSSVLIPVLARHGNAFADEPAQVAQDFLDWVFESPTGKNNVANPEVEDLPNVDTLLLDEAELMTDETVQEEAGVDELFGLPADFKDPAAAKRSTEKLELQSEYKAAISLAQLHQRPLLVLFGAEWCTWCRQLEKELGKPEADTLLRQWVIVKVDVDANAEIAQKMSVSALPALRILSTDQSVVDRHEGFMPLEELQAWLDSKQADADPAIQKILYDSANISSKELPLLIGFLGNRSPELRRAASQRVTSARSDCAGAVVDTLRSGSLAQKLCAFDILSTWKAPIEGIDPWQPATITEQSVAPLIEWLRNQSTEMIDPGVNREQSTMSDESLNQVMVAFLSKASEQPAAAFSETVRYGDALLSTIRQRLALTELSDSNRALLRELLYRILAGERTRLQHSSLLSALASSDSQTHRDAAQRLLANTTSQDEPLIDEMSQDVDALVREMTVPKLQAIGALKSNDRRLRLLQDKSPSVRTAVLRELSENPDSGAITSLVNYLQDETDEDLLVYAAKALGQLGSHAEAENALADLVSNSSWRVRAASLDAIGEMLDGGQYSYSSQPREVSADVATAVLKATEDNDAFVAERAAAILPKTVTEQTAEAIAKYLFENPEKISKFESTVRSYDDSESQSPLVLTAMKSLKSPDLATVRTAAKIVETISPSALKDELPNLLKSNDSETRVIAMRSILALLNRLRDSNFDDEESNVVMSKGVLQPWFDVPQDLIVTRKRAARQKSDLANNPDQSTHSNDSSSSAPSELNAFDDFFGSAQTVADADDQPVSSDEEEPKVVDTASELDALAGFFGESPQQNQPSPTPEVPDTTTANAESGNEPKEPEASQDDDSQSIVGLPSTWLQEWQTKSDDQEWTESWEASLTEVPTDSRTATELQMINLINLARGDVAAAEAVVTALQSQQLDGNESVLTVQDALPWLPADLRLNALKAQAIEWSKISDQNVGEVLQAATLIDDLAITEFIFQGVPSTPSIDDKNTAMFRRFVTRGLFGTRGDQISQYIYPSSYGYGEEPETTIGRERAWEWLHGKFKTASDDNQKAILILIAPYVDYPSGIESSTGFVAQATEYSLALKFATIAALSGNSIDCAHRAAQWLTHPVPEVRKLALQRLMSSPYEFVQAWYNSSVRMEYDYDAKLPPFWIESDLLDRERLELALSMADAEQEVLHLKVLQQAAGQSVDVSEFSSTNLTTKILLVGALAKSERLDDESINFIVSVADTLDQEQASKYYAYIKSLKNDRVAAVRKSLRDQHGASVLEL